MRMTQGCQLRAWQYWRESAERTALLLRVAEKVRGVLQCVAACSIVLQRVAACSSVLQRGAARFSVMEMVRSVTHVDV